MKKISALLCAFLFCGALASNAACPCQSTTPCQPVKQPCCETPKQQCCDAPKQNCCETPAPCCTDDKPTCCNSPKADVIKQESCCWGISQTELFQKLCLDKCQMQKACCLYDKYKCDTKALKEQLSCEQTKLCQMIKNGASNCEIKEQKDKIKCLKKDIKEKWNTYQDDFKCLLTKDQMKEFKKINKEENSDYKQLKKGDCCTKQ